MIQQGFGGEKKRKGQTHHVLVASHLQRRGLSLLPFLLQLSALMVQWHWHEVESNTHFLPRQGRQRGPGDGDGREEDGADGADGGAEDGGGELDEVGKTALMGSAVDCLDFPFSFCSFFLSFLGGLTWGLVSGVAFNCSFNLHSHWLCSMKGNSMSSCFMKEVLISSMVSVCVSKGTHSKASSAQQPPHRLTETQDGTKRWCVSSGSSRQTSTKVSRGSQPLREYTSNHRRTSRPSLDFGESAGLQWASLAWDVGILVSSRNWNIPRITWSIIPIVQESKGHAKIFLDQSKKTLKKTRVAFLSRLCPTKDADITLQSPFLETTPRVASLVSDQELYVVAFKGKHTRGQSVI